jgi:hypothetical protein
LLTDSEIAAFVGLAWSNVVNSLDLDRPVAQKVQTCTDGKSWQNTDVRPMILEEIRCQFCNFRSYECCRVHTPYFGDGQSLLMANWGPTIGRFLLHRHDLSQ